MATYRTVFNSDHTASKTLVEVCRKGVRLSRVFEGKNQKHEAIQWAEDRETEIRLGHLTANNYNMLTMREALERYRKEITAKKRSAYHENYLINRIQREPFMDEKIDKLDDAIFYEMIERRENEGIGAQNIRHELGLIRNMYNVARTKWRMKELKNPFADFEFPELPPMRDRELTTAERNRFYDCLNNYNHTLKYEDENDLLMRQTVLREFRLFVKFQMELGLRRGEALNLEWKYIDLEDGTAHLPVTKTDPRTVPLTSEAKAILNQLRLNPRKPFEHLTARICEYNWKKLCKLAEIENFHIHDMRHDAVTRMIDEELSLSDIRAITGQSLEMLDAYYLKNAKRIAKKFAAKHSNVVQLNAVA